MSSLRRGSAWWLWLLLVAPLGILGAVLANTFRGMERDIYFQVAMLTTVGLTSKNAILIVEFAKENLEKGVGRIEATMHAVRDRLRPIIMTSLAFGLGVLPLAIASGAGSGAQRAIGTGVLGGMISVWDRDTKTEATTMITTKTIMTKTTTCRPMACLPIN